MSVPSKLTNDLFSLWVQAPIVISLRCQAIAAAAWTGSAQDTSEINRMVFEKAAASVESAGALNMALARLGLASFQSMWLGRRPQMSGRQGGALAAAAVRPYAKRVRSNTRRLGRRKA